MSEVHKPRLVARVFPPPIKVTYPKVDMASVTTGPVANRSQMTPFHRRTGAARVPIILSAGEAKQRHEQTELSERARDEVLKHGVKVRDFQAEADARRYGQGCAGHEAGRGTPMSGYKHD
ncbi:hypothetical protein AYO20_00082 [Fonsecaea nubica]|uniref:Uncharacterized protein n=1 Tax=Fonsecaea nubica TaxID=856822 RepID=A0A178DEZ0_9EURO|nr:hypothetical protein AYO20_00082 [Fonsecaea nubica]OAL40346.1 hypothetical protein AYO20_00082 [Fonsecaea nubica]